MKTEINGQKFDLSPTSKTFLEKYLERMNHFIKQNDIEIEVYDDIEERIAEKFTENLSDKKSKKIEDKTVIDIVNEIGEPNEILEELIDNDYETKKEKPKKASNFKKHFEAGENSLTRNSEEGILFGVCYGIGNRYNIDPLWIRLAFVFGTLLRGMTIILYIVLVFLLPNETKLKKKDNGIIGEVEDLTDNFVTDVKKATDKIDVEKYKDKFKFKKDNSELGEDLKDDISDKKIIKEGGKIDNKKIEKKQKNIGLKIKKANLEKQFEYKKNKPNILVRLIGLIAIFFKYIFLFIFHLVKYVFAFALLLGTLPVLVALVFVAGITFTNFQFDNQVLFANVDLLLKLGIVGILFALLFLFFGMFLKIFRSKALSNGLMISGLLGIFIFAFVGGLGFFSTFNEYKSIYTKTENFEFETKELTIKNFDVFGEDESLIERVNRLDRVSFYESDNDKIKIEVISSINSKSKITSEQIFSQMTPIEMSNENEVDFGLDNKYTFSNIVPYSFLRREVNVYIPKDAKINIGNIREYFRMNNISTYSEDNKDYRNVYNSWSCTNKVVEYNEEKKGFVCK